MPSVPVPPFLEALRDHSLLTPQQHEEVVRNLAPRMPDPRILARHLLQQGWLTPYQVNQLFQGRGAELVMGPYLLLERLGEGGTGQVYKARHQRMDRAVAVKVIRPELLTDPEVVQRFYREVQILSQLSHPNVVHAYDAGPIGSTHFLVMEYVEGTDLAVLVKKKGSLPVGQACEYIRQAAAGLAHAHTKGLVHRDIKPSNLLVCTKQEGSSANLAANPTFVLRASSLGVIKILDLGLARLRSGADGEITTNLTPVGAGSVTMGTPDYLAPEQALDFHQVDIRADIYSLGCTFFYVLTGQPPFPGGSMAQKLMRHQQAPPPALAKFRADVPPAVEGVLQRMLAKRPEDRFQTPAEVAAALVETGFDTGSPSALTRRIDVRSTTLGPRRFLQRRWLIAGGALAFVILLAAIFLPGRKKPPDSRSVTERPGTPARIGPVTPTSVQGQPRQLQFVLQGRSLVRDVVLEPDKPARSLGGEPKDNQIYRRDRQEQGSAFLVEFNLAKAGVPDRARVEKAILSFSVWDPSSKGKTKVGAFAVKTSWNEATATWQQADRNQPWKGGKNFAFGVDTWPAASHVIVLPDKDADTVDPPIEYQLNVTFVVQSWLNGTPNYGIAIAAVPDRAVDDGLQTRFQIYASEHPRVQFTPKLTIQLRP